MLWRVRNCLRYTVTKVCLFCVSDCFFCLRCIICEKIQDVSTLIFILLPSSQNFNIDNFKYSLVHIHIIVITVSVAAVIVFCWLLSSLSLLSIYHGINVLRSPPKENGKYNADDRPLSLPSRPVLPKGFDVLGRDVRMSLYIIEESSGKPDGRLGTCLRVAKQS